MEWNNHEKILLLPVLASNAPPSVDHYRMLMQGVPGESLTVDEARLLQFLRGDLDKMQLELSDGTIVSLEDITERRTYVPAYEIWQVTISMECEIENRINISVTERDRIMRESDRVLREQIKCVEQWAPVTAADGQPVSPEYQIKMFWTE